MIHDAWIDAIAHATFQPFDKVAEDYVDLEGNSHLAYIEASMAYLYKHTCMPILLYPRENIPHTFTQKSIRILVSSKIHIRVVQYNQDLYPYYQSATGKALMEESLLKKLNAASIYCVIIMGM